MHFAGPAPLASGSIGRRPKQPSITCRYLLQLLFIPYFLSQLLGKAPRYSIPNPEGALGERSFSHKYQPCSMYSSYGNTTVVCILIEHSQSRPSRQIQSRTCRVHDKCVLERDFRMKQVVFLV